MSQISRGNYKVGQKYLIKTVSSRAQWDTPIDLIAVACTPKVVKVLDLDIREANSVLRYGEEADSIYKELNDDDNPLTEAPNSGFEWVYMEIPDVMPFKQCSRGGYYFTSFEALRTTIRKWQKEHSRTVYWVFYMGESKYTIECHSWDGYTDGKFNNITKTELISK